MFDAIGFGAINLDIIFRVESLSALSAVGLELLPGRELSGDWSTFSKILEAVKRQGRLKAESGGGSAANTIVALSRMGFQTGFIGKVGDDPNGERLRAGMEGVDLRGVVSGGKSGRCLSILDPRQDRFMFLEPNTNDTLIPEDVDYSYATRARYLHLTSFVGERPFLAQRALVDRIRPPTRISFDPGEVYAQRGLNDLRPFLERSFVVFAGEEEIRILTGFGFAEGSRRLLEVGPSIVVCKRGQRGVHVRTRDEGFDLQAKPARVVDNTGAGDVFNAGFLAGLLMGRPLRECASFATRIAARSLTGYGRQRYPERRDLRFFSKPPGGEAGGQTEP